MELILQIKKRQLLKVFQTYLALSVFSIATNVLRLAEVPHSRNFGFEQELSCGILANRCYAYVPTCLAGISFGTRIEIFN